MDENAKEFLIAYAVLCKKYQLCIASEAWEEGGLLLIEYDEAWVEEVALSEGAETFEAYQEAL